MELNRAKCMPGSLSGSLSVCEFMVHRAAYAAKNMDVNEIYAFEEEFVEERVFPEWMRALQYHHLTAILVMLFQIFFISYSKGSLITFLFCFNKQECTNCTNFKMQL